jgi:hypothetical protein
MRVMFDNKLLSSFLLFVDHEIQSSGLAYTNYSGLLYPVESKVSGLYAYATPFRQLCNDTSVAGANILSGVYLNGSFTSIGQNGLHSINHNLGTAYFTGQLSSSVVVSGRYAIKDFNIEITDQLEYKLLFDTKYVTNSKYNQVLSGLASDVKTSPAVFLRPKVLENLPFAFGGIDDNHIDIRAIVIADNQFQRIAVCNILKNLYFKQFQIVQSTPFDYLGNFTGLNYSYETLAFDSSYTPIIFKAKVVDVPLVGDFQNVPRSVAMVDFSIDTIMRT